MSFRDAEGFHIPNKYRDRDMYSKDLIMLWLLMPAIMVIGLILSPFLTSAINIRPFYSELYVCAYAVDTTENEILIQSTFGVFYEDERKPLDFVVESDKNAQILCVKDNDENLQNKMPEAINTSIPITNSTTQIVLQQRNGLKQLIFEKNKDTGKWQPASDSSQFLFFAKHHTINCIIFCLICLILIASLIVPIVLISRKIRTKKHKDKDPFLDEL